MKLVTVWVRKAVFLDGVSTPFGGWWIVLDKMQWLGHLPFMMTALLHIATFLSTASSILLALVTLNHWLFGKFAASPHAYGILALSLIGVCIDGGDLLSELGHSGVLAVGWHGLMFALDVGFIVTVYRRLAAFRQAA